MARPSDIINRADNSKDFVEPMGEAILAVHPTAPTWLKPSTPPKELCNQLDKKTRNSLNQLKLLDLQIQPGKPLERHKTMTPTAQTSTGASSCEQPNQRSGARTYVVVRSSGTRTPSAECAAPKSATRTVPPLSMRQLARLRSPCTMQLVEMCNSCYQAFSEALCLRGGQLHLA